MRIDDQFFRIIYDKETLTIAFYGSLRMSALEEFERVRKFMMDAYELEGPALILDFRALEFMNSAGISTLCRFIFDVKDSKRKTLAVVGNERILWQKKSFENLKKIWSELVVRFE